MLKQSTERLGDYFVTRKASFLVMTCVGGGKGDAERSLAGLFADVGAITNIFFTAWLLEMFR